MGPYSTTSAAATDISTDEMSRCKEIKRYMPATVAWFLLISTTTLFFIFLTEWYVTQYSIWIPIGEGIVTVVVVANFTLATFMDPGVIPKAIKGEDDNDDLRAPLYKTVEVHGITVRMKWCVTCQFYRPPRCSHCSVCNNCIETFDHHCPWVNNCIGRRNYRFFFMFLLSLSIHMVSIFVLCLLYMLQHMEKMSEPSSVVAMSIMVVISILFIPILGLTGFHIILVSRGRTTNEQVTGKYRGGYNPFSRGCCLNCWFTLCGPHYPGLERAKRNREASNANVSVRYIAQQPNLRDNANSESAMLQSGPSSQVNVYVDNGQYNQKMKSGTLHTLHSPRSYHQMMPASGRDITDHDIGLQQLQASQSLDCEPTPPMQRHGSKTNFFLPTTSTQDDMNLSHMRNFRGPYTHGSPHPNRQRNGDGGRSRSHTPDSISSPSENLGMSGLNNASPTLHQKIRAIGVPTPFAVSASPQVTQRSNPPTPTQSGRPEFMGTVQHNNSALQYTSRSHVPPYYDTYNLPNGEQRRILSEGELIYDRQYGIPNVPRDQSGPIRELASSPQRGVYMWKDNSPTSAGGVNYFHSNPTSPIQHNMMNNGNGRVYCQAAPHGAYNPNNQKYSVPPQQQPQPPPLSPSTKKKLYGVIGVPSSTLSDNIRPSPISRRPMSFVRALEMTDSLDMPNRGSNNHGSPGTPKGTGQQSHHVNDISDRSSVYDTNYEISV